MTADDRESAESRGLAALVQRLPRDVDPPVLLWERIAARLPRRTALDSRAGALPREISPPEDLWPAIAARVGAPPWARLTRTRVGAAAAAVLVVGAVLFRVLYLGSAGDDAAPRGEPLPATAPSNANVARSAAPSGARGVAWILGAPTLSVDVAATLDREIALVRDERLRIEAAIDREPDNVELRKLWTYAYEIELQLADTCGRTLMDYERG